MNLARRVALFAVGLTLMAFAPVHLQAQNAGMFDGRPTFKEGWDMGYWVWREDNRWHVRWTTMGRMRRFSGTVIAEGGELEDLKRIDVEVERRVIAPGRAPHYVRGPRGRIRGVAPGRAPVVATREQDRIEKDHDQKISFIAHTDDDIDGFDFSVDRVAVLRFNLGIDGKPRQGVVEVGRNNSRPGSNPFFVNLK